MPYLKAALLGLLIALALGAGVGLRATRRLGAWNGSPQANAAAYSEGVAEGLNCAAFFGIVCVPAAVAALFVKRRTGARQ
jgi:hypothetical protein